MKKNIETIAMFIIGTSQVWGLILLGIIYQYTQRYIQINNDTATSGIYFQNTISIKEHKKLGNGNGLFGLYEIYTRSDRQNEVIKIYIK